MPIVQNIWPKSQQGKDRKRTKTKRLLQMLESTAFYLDYNRKQACSCTDAVGSILAQHLGHPQKPTYCFQFSMIVLAAHNYCHYLQTMQTKGRKDVQS
jgi:hypothetical protein